MEWAALTLGIELRADVPGEGLEKALAAFDDEVSRLYSWQWGKIRYGKDYKIEPKVYGASKVLGPGKARKKFG